MDGLDQWQPCSCSGRFPTQQQHSQRTRQPLTEHQTAAHRLYEVTTCHVQCTRSSHLAAHTVHLIRGPSAAPPHPQLKRLQNSRLDQRAAWQDSPRPALSYQLSEFSEAGTCTSTWSYFGTGARA